MIDRLRRLLGRQEAPASAAYDFPTVAYDRDLTERLGGLLRWQQVAFAAACAERLYPAYSAFRMATRTDDGGIVREALDLAWEGAAIDVVGDPHPAALVERCVQLIPDQDADFTIPNHADDAIAAAAYALEAAAGLRDQAVGWAAERGTSALDAFLTSTQIPWAGGTREDAARIDKLVWQHPLVRAEVERREGDLARLARGDRDAAVRDVRAGSTGVSLLPLDELVH